MILSVCSSSIVPVKWNELNQLKQIFALHNCLLGFAPDTKIHLKLFCLHKLFYEYTLFIIFSSIEVTLPESMGYMLPKHSDGHKF